MENEKLSSDKIKARNMKCFFTIIMIAACALCFGFLISEYIGEMNYFESYLIRKHKNTAIDYVKEKYGFTPTVISGNSDFYCYGLFDSVCIRHDFSRVLYSMEYDGKKFDVFVPFEEYSYNVFNAKIDGKLADDYQYEDIENDFLNSVNEIIGGKPYRSDIYFYSDGVHSGTMFNEKYESNNISEFLKDASIHIKIDYIDSIDEKKVDLLREKYNIEHAEFIMYKSEKDYKLNKCDVYCSSSDPSYINKVVIIDKKLKHSDEDEYVEYLDKVEYYDFSIMNNPVPFEVDGISEIAKVSDVHISKSNDIGNLKIDSKYTVVSPVYTINTSGSFYVGVEVYIDKNDIANYNEKENYKVLRYEDGKFEDEHYYGTRSESNYHVFGTHIDEDVSNVQFVVVKVN